MCVWAMQQGDEFYDQQLNESRYGGGVWNMIASVLKVGAAAPPHVADAGAGEGSIYGAGLFYCCFYGSQQILQA